MGRPTPTPTHPHYWWWIWYKPSLKSTKLSLCKTNLFWAFIVMLAFNIRLLIATLRVLFLPFRFVGFNQKRTFDTTNTYSNDILVIDLVKQVGESSLSGLSGRTMKWIKWRRSASADMEQSFHHYQQKSGAPYWFQGTGMESSSCHMHVLWPLFYLRSTVNLCSD